MTTYIETKPFENGLPDLGRLKELRTALRTRDHVEFVGFHIDVLFLGAIDRSEDNYDEWYDGKADTFNPAISFDAVCKLAKKFVPEWRIAVYEQSSGKWFAVFDRNYLGRLDNGPHEVRSSDKDNHQDRAAAAILDAFLTVILEGKRNGR